MSNPSDIIGNTRTISQKQLLEFLTWLKNEGATEDSFTNTASFNRIKRWIEQGNLKQVIESMSYQRWVSLGMPTGEVEQPETVTDPYVVTEDENGNLVIKTNTSETNSDSSDSSDSTDTTKKTAYYDPTSGLVYDNFDGKTYSGNPRLPKIDTTSLAGYEVIIDPTSGEILMSRQTTTSNDNNDLITTLNSQNQQATANWNEAAYNQDYLQLQRDQLEWEKAKWQMEQEQAEKERIQALGESPKDWIQYWQAQYGTLPTAPTWLNKYMGTNVNSPVTQTISIPAEPQPSDYATAEDYYTALKKWLVPYGTDANGNPVTNGQIWNNRIAAQLDPRGEWTGGTIQALDVPTPSGQWLNRVSPTIKLGLQGYTNWSAAQGKSKSWDDLLQQTSNMLPRSEPYSRNSWRATRQVGW